MLGRKREDLGSKADAKKRKKWQERAGKDPCDTFPMSRRVDQWTNLAETLRSQERSEDDDEPAEASVTAEEMEEWKARNGRFTGWVDERPKWLKKSCAGQFANSGRERLHAESMWLKTALPKCQLLHVCLPAEIPAFSRFFACGDLCGFSSRLCQRAAHCRVPWLPSGGVSVPRSRGRRANWRGPGGA